MGGHRTEVRGRTIRTEAADAIGAMNEAGGAEGTRRMTMIDENALSAQRPNWQLSFRILHPSADLSALAERIGDAFDMDPEAVWRAGDPYPNARPPGQVRGRSYCTIPWPNDQGTVATGMADALAALAPLRGELAALVADGAGLEFFVGLFVESMMGLVLRAPLLARMAEMGIALDLDIYGGPGDAPMGALGSGE